MSIKGKSQELYIGKTEINIKDYQWGYKDQMRNRLKIYSLTKL